MKFGILVCKECGGNSFTFRWRWKDTADLITLTMCHDGYGFQFEDADITCNKCGRINPETKIKEEEAGK